MTLLLKSTGQFRRVLLMQPKRKCWIFNLFTKFLQIFTLPNYHQTMN